MEIFRPFSSVFLPCQTSWTAFLRAAKQFHSVYCRYHISTNCPRLLQYPIPSDPSDHTRQNFSYFPCLCPCQHIPHRIRTVTEMIRSDVEGFQEDWLQCRREDQEKSIREDKRRLAQARKRLADIDVLMTRIYEDMALGNLSRERYQKMAEGYEAEQAKLNNEIVGLEDWIVTREEMDDSFDRFSALVEKYVDIPELTPAIVNEFIKKIIVYAPEKQGSRRIQKIRIIFNFLDELDMPEIGGSVVTETTYGRRKTA